MIDFQTCSVLRIGLDLLESLLLCVSSEDKEWMALENIYIIIITITTITSTVTISDTSYALSSTLDPSLRYLTRSIKLLLLLFVELVKWVNKTLSLSSVTSSSLSPCQAISDMDVYIYVYILKYIVLIINFYIKWYKYIHTYRQIKIYIN